MKILNLTMSVNQFQYISKFKVHKFTKTLLLIVQSSRCDHTPSNGFTCLSVHTRSFIYWLCGKFDYQ